MFFRKGSKIKTLLSDTIVKCFKLFSKSIEEKRRRKRESSERSEQQGENTSTHRNAGLGMARLAEFIGGAHFEGRRNHQNENSSHGEEQHRNSQDSGRGERSLIDEGRRVQVASVSIVQTSDAGNNDGIRVSWNEHGRIERSGENPNPAPEFRIRTLVDGIERRSSSSGTEETLNDSRDNQSSQNNDGEIASNTNTSNDSSLVDIIQMLGSVAGSDNGTLRIRRSTRLNENQPNMRPNNQDEDSRVPPAAQSTSRINLESNSSNSTRSRSLAANSPLNSSERDEQPSNRQRRNQLGQQGFIIFPPDPLNAGGGPSILYFGGSGDGEGVAADGVPDLRLPTSQPFGPSFPPNTNRDSPAYNRTEQYIR